MDKRETLSDAIREEFPDDDEAVIQGMISDLVARNLVVNRATWFGLATMNPEKISDLGLDLLGFITDPLSPA